VRDGLGALLIVAASLLSGRSMREVKQPERDGQA